MRFKNICIFMGTFLLLFLFFPFFVFAQQLPKEKIVLKFYHAMDNHRNEFMNYLIDDFNKKNPNLKVVGVQVKAKSSFGGNAYNELYTTILKNIDNNTPPDLAQVYENWTVQLLDIGAIIPIGDYINKKDIDDFIPIFKEANIFNGKLWTVPFNKSIYVLYYNKDMMDRVQLSPPKTWVAFKEATKKLTVVEDNKVKIYGITFKPSVDIFGHFLYSYRGVFIRNNKAVFGESAGFKAINFWTNLVHEDSSACISFVDREDFIKQRSAMFFDTTSKIAYFKKKLSFNWGVALIPKGDIRKFQFAGTNIAIFSHLSDKKKKAALKFVRYLVSKPVTTYWAINTGYLPVRKSALWGEKYQKIIRNDCRYKIGIESLKYAVSQPKIAAWEMIRGVIDDAMYEATSLKKPPIVALKESVELSNKIIKDLNL